MKREPTSISLFRINLLTYWVMCCLSFDRYSTNWLKRKIIVIIFNDERAIRERRFVCIAVNYKERRKGKRAKRRRRREKKGKGKEKKGKKEKHIIAH